MARLERQPRAMEAAQPESRELKIGQGREQPPRTSAQAGLVALEMAWSAPVLGTAPVWETAAAHASG